MQKKTLDNLDIELLKLLIEDGRQSYVQLSKKMNTHKDTIRKRVRKLLDLRVIDRFTITINHERLTETYPSLWRVIFTVVVLHDRNNLFKELVNHKNVIEVDEATPAAIQDLLVHAEFKDMREFDEFTKWLRSKQNIDSTRFNVIPIYKQHKRRSRIMSVIET